MAVLARNRKFFGHGSDCCPGREAARHAGLSRENRRAGLICKRRTRVAAFLSKLPGVVQGAEIASGPQQRLEAQGVVGQNAVMQSGRAHDALTRKVDDALRNDLSAALIAVEYLEIGARQFKRD